MRSYLRDVMIFSGVVPIHQFYCGFTLLMGNMCVTSRKQKKSTGGYVFHSLFIFIALLSEVIIDIIKFGLNSAR